MSLRAAIFLPEDEGSAEAQRLKAVASAFAPALRSELVRLPLHELPHGEAVERFRPYGTDRLWDLLAVASSAELQLLTRSLPEFLASVSEVPILAVGPDIESIQAPRQILFTTNFSLGSQRVFCRLLPLANAFSARVIVFHAMPIPADLPVSPEPRPYSELEDKLSSPWLEAGYAQRARAQALVDIANAHGARAEILLDGSGLALGELILKLTVSRQFELVALAIHDGPVERRMTTPFMRQLLRYCLVPLWLLNETRAEQPGRIAA